MTSHEQVTERMEALVQQWESTGDNRSIFLGCYLLMTRNMLVAINHDEFKDSKWVNRLLNRFAEYYFVAVDEYEDKRPEIPIVWQIAMEKANHADTFVIQNLLLGVNAHINYDLVYTLEETLYVEWENLSETEREIRFLDHCQVNEVIGRTIDAVHDTIIESRVPRLDLIDKVLGPIDEWSISWLISKWRYEVWENAVSLLEIREQHQREMLRRTIEKKAVDRAEMILRIL